MFHEDSAWERTNTQVDAHFCIWHGTNVAPFRNPLVTPEATLGCIIRAKCSAHHLRRCLPWRTYSQHSRGTCPCEWKSRWTLASRWPLTYPYRLPWKGCANVGPVSKSNGTKKMQNKKIVVVQKQYILLRNTRRGLWLRGMCRAIHTTWLLASHAQGGTIMCSLRQMLHTGDVNRRAEIARFYIQKQTSGLNHGVSWGGILLTFRTCPR